jgi:hypothetical protein
MNISAIETEPPRLTMGGKILLFSFRLDLQVEYNRWDWRVIYPFPSSVNPEKCPKTFFFFFFDFLILSTLLHIPPFFLPSKEEP